MFGNSSAVERLAVSQEEVNCMMLVRPILSFLFMKNVGFGAKFLPYFPPYYYS
jgi:hypothetical protein